MTTLHDPPTSGAVPGAGDPRSPLVDLTLMQVAVEQAATADDAAGYSEAELVDQIQRIESVQNSLAALQADRVRAFARAHVAARIAAGVVDPDKLERAAVAQVALACRVSPTEGRHRVRAARDLREGLDHVRGLFAAGELSRDKVAAVVDGGSTAPPTGCAPPRPPGTPTSHRTTATTAGGSDGQNAAGTGRKGEGEPGCAAGFSSPRC